MVRIKACGSCFTHHAFFNDLCHKSDFPLSFYRRLTGSKTPTTKIELKQKFQVGDQLTVIARFVRACPSAGHIGVATQSCALSLCSSASVGEIRKPLLNKVSLYIPPEPRYFVYRYA